MAFSPKTGLVYFPVVEAYMAYAASPTFDPASRTTGENYGGYDAKRKELAAYADAHSKAWLTAWDPAKRKEAWRVPYPRDGSGGVLATAGNLVIEGTVKKTLAIYRADTGAKLWESGDIQSVPIAAPITYMEGGEQYVAVNVGWGGGLAHVQAAAFRDLNVAPARLLVFKLGGAARLPPPPPISPPPEPPPVRATEAEVKKLAGGKKGDRKRTEKTVVADVQKRLASHFATPVTVVRKGSKGAISIPFSSDDDLARLLEKIGVKL
jgi:quinohemoprotein ethanol dehydrogenase